MRVSRSLTIKQMAMVSAVTLTFIFMFCLILLVHFVQQNRDNTAMQLESIARSVREPLAATILQADIPQAESILRRIQPAGIVSRADVVLPNQFQALHVSFIPQRPVPAMVARLFALPLQISLPLYSLERPVNARLVLQADSYRLYKFIASALSILVTTYLLLALMMTIAITWCINRLIIHPLRKVARELNDLSAQDVAGHQLSLPRIHYDDEIGLLVRSYNRNQQILARREVGDSVTRFPVSGLPDKAFLMTLLEQAVACRQTAALMIVTCETLRDSASVLHEQPRQALLLMLVEKLKALLTPEMVLAQVSGFDFAILFRGVEASSQATLLSKQVLTTITGPLSVQSIQLRPCASIGIAVLNSNLTVEQFWRQAISAAFSACRKGKNQIQFFEPAQIERSRQRLTEESDILNALNNNQFSIWLQPQVAIASGKVLSAEVLLRIRQADGSWALPDGLIRRIESCGMMVTVGSWVLEASCRLLAGWQARGVMIPLSVNLSVLQLMEPGMVTDLLALLDRYRIKPATLILEITESCHINDPHAMVEILRPLRGAGVRVALDDFGMGHATLCLLQYMKSLPVDILKIDKMFVAGLPEDSSIVNAIIMLARSLQLDIIAEGVETAAQRDWLQRAGVEVAQGLLFARTIPADIFEAYYLPGEKQ